MKEKTISFDDTGILVISDRLANFCNNLGLITHWIISTIFNTRTI